MRWPRAERLASPLVLTVQTAPKIAIALSRIGNSEAELAEGMEYVRASGYHLLDGVLFEKTAVRRASDEGKCATETGFKTINEKADVLVQAIVNRVEEVK